MRYKAVFIDIDDTLLDYIPCCREAFDYALQELKAKKYDSCTPQDEDYLFQLFFAKQMPLKCRTSQKSAMSREEGAAAASQLSRIAIESLSAGKQLCFYPSGHIKTIDKEMIGNRRMAYEVCKELPDGVRVILCRMRGLETSRWSKLKPKQWKWRRTVTLIFEDHTDDVRIWAQTLDRRTFNEHLETWYNLPK
jgi:phosphoglycolate phosphatase-like HAD superfamily hydrolase